ncbi:hypothetical protein [Streptomyces sp. NPDC058457]|uniref:hypothetical protein n=1 Tax=Streptomyces sp. NPDC058457 TaxID=3346507 RepID=UPI0036486C8D
MPESDARRYGTENIVWADQRGLPVSPTAHLLKIGGNQMRTLLKQVRPLLERHGHHSEPLPVRPVDPCDLARYVMAAASTAT